MTEGIDTVSLSWDKFQSNAEHTFRNLRNDPHFTDVTLVCRDYEHIQAHKVILSSCSPFFKHILVNSPHKNPLLFLNGVTSDDLQSLLQFMYSGEAQVKDENLPQFLFTANEFKIEGLTTIDVLPTTAKEVTINNIECEDSDISRHINNLEESDVMKSKNISDIEDKKSEKETVIYLPPGMVEQDMVEKIPDNCIEENIKEIEGAKCDICDKQFVNKYVVKKHNNSVHEGLRFLCDHCDFLSSSKDNVRTHITCMHPNQELPVIYTSVKRKDLSIEQVKQEQQFTKEHKKSDVNKQPAKFIKCKLCPYKSKFRVNLKRHKKSHCTKARDNPNVSTLMGQGQDDFQESEEKNETQNEYLKTSNKYECETCHKNLANQGSLRVHTLSKHEGMKYPCQFCDYKASTNNNLKRHKKSMHMDI